MHEIYWISMGCFLTHANVCSFWWFISYFISDTLLYHTKACVTYVQACTTIQSNPLYFVQFCFVSVYFRGSWKYNTVINTDTEQQYSTVRITTFVQWYLRSSSILNATNKDRNRNSRKYRSSGKLLFLVTIDFELELCSPLQRSNVVWK